VTPGDHRRVKELFQRAEELPAGEREAFLAASDAGEDLLSEVRRLLRASAGTPAEFLAPSVEPAVAPGRRLGPYAILSALGAGAMGEVWRARDTRLDRDVALKVLPPELGATLRAHFEREARAVAALSHPNILALYDVGREGRVAYVVTELLEGETLRERLARGALGASQAIAFATAIARALAAAHAKGIVHRDLKPENVFLTSDGHVKLLDFGIASGPAEDAVVGGTPGYMAPEQACGSPPDPRADLFALGCVLYEMLAGRRAFQRATLPETLDAVAWAPPPPLSGVAPAVERIVRRCLEKEPAKRFASARDVEQAIEDALASTSRLMLAVLPFESIGSDPEQERFAEGMTEEMITVLGRAGPHRLGVIARTSAMQFKGRREPVDAIGRALGVDHVVEGSVRRQGDRVRIAATLVQVSDQAQLWSDSFDGTLTDILALQADVARRIAGALSVELQPRFRGRRPTTDPRAYDAYLAGRACFYRASEQGWRAALDFYREAVALDPSFALAHAAIASGSTVWALWGTTPPSEACATASAAVARAQEREPDLPEVHATLALVRTFFEWDWPRAEEEFRRAIALNPSDGEVYHWYAHYLLFQGRPEEALDALADARRFDPLSTFHRECLAGHYVATGDLGRAEPWLRDVLQQRPGSPLALHFQGWLHERRGRIDDAVASWEAAARASDIPNLVATVGYGYARAGRVSDARAISDELERRAARGYVAAQDRAKVFAGLGERDTAFEWLEEAFRRHEAWLAALPLEPGFDTLRGDRRFAALLGRIGVLS
jgi:TolB-like protein/tetratricopeptide (TPR) repeat protein